MQSETPREGVTIDFAKDSDRRSFLKYAALVGVGGALVGGAGSAFAATTPSPSASPSAAPSSFGAGDVGILNYALTLEYLEADFYAQGLQANILGDDAKYLMPIAQHEAAHVQAITATLQKLGATPAAKPTFKYPAGTFTDKAMFLKTASTFEETGVKAYHGQVPLITDPAILGAAASIAGVESRHASVLNLINKQKPVPAPVEAHASMDEIVTAIKPFLGS
ncbi:MAG TPA: ferritin-like domain-containing protein [Candidatus Dormibacteraeota bacterium]